MKIIKYIRYLHNVDASLVRYQMEADVTARRFNVVFRAKSRNFIIGILLHGPPSGYLRQRY